MFVLLRINRIRSWCPEVAIKESRRPRSCRSELLSTTYRSTETRTSPNGMESMSSIVSTAPFQLMVIAATRGRLLPSPGDMVPPDSAADSPGDTLLPARQVSEALSLQNSNELGSTVVEGVPRYGALLGAAPHRFPSVRVREAPSNLLGQLLRGIKHWHLGILVEQAPRSLGAPENDEGPHRGQFVCSRRVLIAGVRPAPHRNRPRQRSDENSRVPNDLRILQPAYRPADHPSAGKESSKALPSVAKESKTHIGHSRLTSKSLDHPTILWAIGCDHRDIAARRQSLNRHTEKRGVISVGNEDAPVPIPEHLTPGVWVP